jgi:hypothetical protein
MLGSGSEIVFLGNHIVTKYFENKNGEFSGRPFVYLSYFGSVKRDMEKKMHMFSMKRVILLN